MPARLPSRSPVASPRRTDGPPARTPGRWRDRAAALAGRIGAQELHPATLAWLRGRRGRQAGHVAFSGGADSLALLLLLHAHFPAAGRWRALHFNHRLRGVESTGDAAFCRQVCRALGIPLRVGSWRHPPADPGEDAARAARQQFFAAHSRVLWLGHQRDDVAETLLMRLARGSGTAGLAAPRPVQSLPGGRTHLRPLLGLAKDRLVAELRALGIPWREDASNATARHFRNRVRRDVVDAWARAAGRDAVGGAALSRELLEEDDAALEGLLGRLKFLRGRQLDLAVLRDQPRALVRRALHCWLQRQRPVPRLSRPAFSALLAAVENGRPTRQSLDARRLAEIRGARLLVTAARPRRFDGK